MVVVVNASYFIASIKDFSEDTTNVSISITAAVVGGIAIVIGLLGAVGAFTRSKGFLTIYAVLLIVLAVVQCVAGGLALGLVGNRNRLDSIGSSIWENMAQDSKLNFQNNNSCCGYRNLADRPAGLCVALSGCGNAFVDSLGNILQAAAICMFISFGLEVFAVIIALVLIFDDRRRERGYGYPMLERK